MNAISLDKMTTLIGGVTPRECWLAGVGVLLTASVLGVAMGWFQSNLSTVVECFE